MTPTPSPFATAVRNRSFIRGALLAGALLAPSFLAATATAECGAGGSCYSVQFTPFCNDAACCTAVCAVDPFCCFNSWDADCVEEAGTICLTCGGAGAGDCFVVGAAACNDATCCTAVCDFDPTCCSSTWDSACVNDAIVLCKSCGGPGSGSCFATGGPACDEGQCCSAVCSVDSFCCSTAWDGACVNAALQLCTTCGGAGAGDCFELGGPACNDADCCNAVCSVDDFCCLSQWDDQCVARANELCVVEVVLGPIVNFANGNAYYLLDESIWTKAEAKALSLGGHLVTINDAAENQWVWTTLANGSGSHPIWIGLNDLAVQGTFVWVSGQPVTFTAWGQGEPNNQGGNERYVEMFAGAPAWNDNDLLGTGVLENFSAVEVEMVGCGDEAAGECFAVHSGVGCADGACCFEVCNADPFCCTNTWDALCASAANMTCGGCGDPESGSCTSTHGPHCSNGPCCYTVCQMDPFCCETSWDNACVNGAVALCLNGCLGDIDGDGIVGGADLGLLLGSWGQAGGGAGDVNLDGATDGADIGQLLGAWGDC